MQWIDQNVGYYIKLKLHKLCRKSLNFNFIQIFDALVCYEISLGIRFFFFFFGLHYLVCKYLD
uniref:Uncharacterized protein n=1 Tax=Cebus imitator TaxID=2715852 RepID=A0A2K5PQB2_CEBIM